MASGGRLRNIAFKLALIVMSVALAAFGVLGWADSARALDAYAERSWAILDPLWPVYAVAAVACLAAQVIAACAVVNFARLVSAHWLWRFGAFAFYAVAVFFAAYSADRGAQVVLTAAHRAAYQANVDERTRLQNEIQSLAEAIEEERGKLPSDTENTMTSRQTAALALFEAATATARARLPEAQRELRDLPRMERDPVQDWSFALSVFLIFLAWAILEPWGYAIAERGREPPLQGWRPASQDSRGAKVHWLQRVAAFVSLAWLSQFANPVLAAPAPPANPRETPEPITLSAAIDAKAVAFSMRGRFAVCEIARKVGVHQATVYRWFRKRDLEAAKAA